MSRADAREQTDQHHTSEPQHRPTRKQVADQLGVSVFKVRSMEGKQVHPVRENGVHYFEPGIVDGQVVDWRRDAREELRALGQLQRGYANVLVVDLTAKHVVDYMIDSYKEVAAGVFKSHPELSAILLVWRHFGLQPSPSRHHELRTGYLRFRCPRIPKSRSSVSRGISGTQARRPRPSTSAIS
jgi:hypothetical protein